jgi:Uma2 family endonuclease
MNAPAKKPPVRATYQDLEAVPPNKVAELIGGVLHVMPRPAPRHAQAEGAVQGELFGPFHRGRGGPGGWWILPEPELHFPDPSEAGEIDAISPDVAGWRRERMPALPATAYFELAPDWICEVVSRSTEDVDRNEKMPIYAREGVRHAWLVDPIAKTLEVYRLNLRRRWSKPEIHRGAARVRVPPFDAIELDLDALWADVGSLAPVLGEEPARPAVTTLPRLRKAAKKAPRR